MISPTVPGDGGGPDVNRTFASGRPAQAPPKPRTECGSVEWVTPAAPRDEGIRARRLGQTGAEIQDDSRHSRPHGQPELRPRLGGRPVGPLRRVRRRPGRTRGGTGGRTGGRTGPRPAGRDGGPPRGRVFPARDQPAARLGGVRLARRRPHVPEPAPTPPYGPRRGEAEARRLAQCGRAGRRRSPVAELAPAPPDGPGLGDPGVPSVARRGRKERRRNVAPGFASAEAAESRRGQASVRPEA
jgi:hypothetical protein